MAERIREKVNASHAFEILASFPGLSRRGKAWGLLHAHARNIPIIFRKIYRILLKNDVIEFGESARMEYADRHLFIT